MNYSEIENNIIIKTDNYTKESGILFLDYLSSAEIAEMILKKYYKNVILDSDISNRVIIEYSDPINNLEESYSYEEFEDKVLKAMELYADVLERLANE